jgi:hypothetical protein
MDNNKLKERRKYIMNKNKIIAQLKTKHEEAIKTLERIREGDMTYSEAGEYYHDDLGDSIIYALENAIDYINSIK